MKVTKLVKLLLYFLSPIVVFALCVILAFNALFGPTTNSPLGRGEYNDPAWSPDGSYLAFLYSPRIRLGVREGLWLYEAETGEFTYLETKCAIVIGMGLSWQDNRTLWFASHGPDLYTHECDDQLYRIDVRTGVNEIMLDLSTLLAENGELPAGETSAGSRFHISSFSVRPFGDQVFMGLWNGDEVTLHSFSVSRPTVIQHYDLPVIWEGLSWSPDGELLLIRMADGGALLNLQGALQVLGIPVSDRFTWSPDDQWLLSVGGWSHPGLNLVSAVGTGEVYPVLQRDVARVSWSPNGVHVAYTTVGSPGQNELHIVQASDLGLEIPIDPESLNSRQGSD